MELIQEFGISFGYYLNIWNEYQFVEDSDYTIYFA
jgi:hypothetical protein